MKCFVLILAILAGARAVAAAAASCALSEDFFMRHNVSADDNDEPGSDFCVTYIYVAYNKISFMVHMAMREVMIYYLRKMIKKLIN